MSPVPRGIREAGRRARDGNQTLDANPFMFGTVDRRDWREGWVERDDEMRQNQPRFAKVIDVRTSMVTVEDDTGERHHLSGLLRPRDVHVGDEGFVNYRSTSSMGAWWFDKGEKK